jgi:broad specificity phosphatase PhoE
MSEEISWFIPPSTLRWLAEAPSDRPVALLLRHSVRPPLAELDAGYALPITDAGRQLAVDLGRRIGERLRSVHASPLLRCVQTAEALTQGAAVDLEVARDTMLGDPGAFVVDNRLAWPNWRDLRHEGVMAHLVSADVALPGMAEPGYAARSLVHHMLTQAGLRPGVHVFVTHDSLVTAAAARMLGEPLGRDAWPLYLEAAFFWQQGGELVSAYRDARTVRSDAPLRTLCPHDVVEFARREVGAVLGLDLGARFCLAGGAFKSLITGHPPRDLDLWAATARDRLLLLERLEARGAKSLPPRPYSDAFEVSGRVVELPHRVDRGSLEDLFLRFDLALSAVGAEHSPGDAWRAVIHPRALDSVNERRVFVLEPLANPRHALSSIARLRRYVAELGYASHPEDEALLWQVFARADAVEREVMLERYHRAAMLDPRVLEEALALNSA